MIGSVCARLMLSIVSREQETRPEAGKYHGNAGNSIKWRLLNGLSRSSTSRTWARMLLFSRRVFSLRSFMRVDMKSCCSMILSMKSLSKISRSGSKLPLD